MVARNFALLVMFSMLFAPPVHAERVLEKYDIDSLSAMAKLIVKAEVGAATDVHTRDGDCSVWDVKVVSTLHGDVKPESMIRVAGIEVYHKGPGIVGVDKGYPRLSKGDVVYLFLLRKGDRGGYAMYDLTDADWKVIESGACIVVNDRVHSFAQYWPPGLRMTSAGFVAMTAETFPKAPVLSVEEFEKKVQASLAFASELRRKLAANALIEAEKRAVLAGRAEVLKRELARSDYIPWLIYDEPRQPATRPAG